MWKKGSQEDSSWGAISELIPLLARTEHQVVVGSDSQPFRDGFVVATAVCFCSSDQSLHRRYFYERVKHRCKPKSLYERIYSETMASVTTANKLREICPSLNICVDLDVSRPTSTQQTAKYSTAMIGIVKGFAIEEVKIKPEAWGASAVADWHTKVW